jgi:ATP-dependent DNA helicase RecG
VKPLSHDPPPFDPLGENLSAILGKGTAKKLAAKLGLNTVDDLLRHYPRRYAQPGVPTDFSGMRVGEYVSVFARIKKVTTRTSADGKRGIMTVIITDEVQDFQLTFFGRSERALGFRERELHQGAWGMFSGTVTEYRGDRQLTHPDYSMLDETTSEAALKEEATKPIPVYQASATTPTWNVRKSVRTVLTSLTPSQVPDPIPATVLAELGYPTRWEALNAIHHPGSAREWERAQERFRFEEAFLLQTSLAQRRHVAAQDPATARPLVPGGKRADGTPSLLAAFDANLPFTLTAGQRAVGEEIAQDLARPTPMQRLLQGEVGSGKTLVALRAMLQVMDAGGQAALLAPTEVLAYQHARTLRGLLNGDLVHGDLPHGDLLHGGTRPTATVTLLTGSLKTAARRQALLDAASGNAGIVVGTHALLSEGVQFADLGLIVVDEQHRFGVEQRDALRAKATTAPHLLVMTATPIPRSLAMTAFGDLDVSMLTEIPAGRSGVQTHVVPLSNTAWFHRIWQRVAEEARAGHRTFVVCPRIHPDGSADVSNSDGADFSPDDDAALTTLPTPGPGGEPAPASSPHAPAPPAEPAPPAAPLQAVLDVAVRLQHLPALAGVNIGMLHGQMSPEEKDAAMAAFARGDTDVLVATTVIEVGVDIPEATMMVVFDADRFGLSQLHQLRGRIGRGSAPGVCLLLTNAVPGTTAAQRTQALADTSDGFALAEMDLALRREGDVLGANQSGRGSLRLLQVSKHGEVIAQARGYAAAVVDSDPALERHPALKAAIGRQFDASQEEFLEKT